jgi:phage gpG-like protein
LRTSVTSRGGKGNIERKGPTFLEWGTNIEYAKYHQGGTSRIPARPFLGIGEELGEKLEMIAADWVEEQVKRALGG